MTVQYSVAVRNARADAWALGAISGQYSLTPFAWTTSTAVTAFTSWCQNSGNVYLCTQSGTTSSSPGGPSGNTPGAQITDGTAQWLWIGRQAIGDAGAICNIYTGSQPANCAASETGTLLASFTLSTDWSALASSGNKTVAGLPMTATAGNSGIAGHFRLMDVTGTTCHMQGSVTATGGGGDATIDNVNITTGQTVTWTGFSATEAGA